MLQIKTAVNKALINGSSNTKKQDVGLLVSQNQQIGVFAFCRIWKENQPRVRFRVRRQMGGCGAALRSTHSAQALSRPATRCA